VHSSTFSASVFPPTCNGCGRCDGAHRPVAERITVICGDERSMRARVETDRTDPGAKSRERLGVVEGLR